MFVCKSSLKMEAPLSNCTVVEQQGVILVCVCVCVCVWGGVRKKFIGEWQHNMVTTDQHRKMQMNGWADLSVEGKLTMMKINQASLQSRTDDHCAEVDALIEENLCLMDSRDDRLRFPPSFLLLYSSQLLL